MRRLVLVVLVSAAACHGGAANTMATPPPPLSTAEVVKVCAMALSCLSPGPASTGAECAYDLERADVKDEGQPVKAFAACAATANDCAAALDCETLGHVPDYCAAHPEHSCDGELAVTCFPLTMPAWADPPVDCHALGMTCVNGACTDGKTCTGEIVSQCVGHDLVGCDQSTHMEGTLDCTLVYPGGTCGQVAAAPGCVPPGGGLCARGSGPYACEGDVLLGCASLLDGKLDCSKIASQCVDTTGIADCVPTATGCTRTSPDRCDGAALVFCVDGHYQAFDCSTVGLGPCQVTTMGRAACAASGVDGAADAPAER
jgi:hypothetical protein